MTETIRRATKGDLDAIRRIVEAAYSPWIGIIGRRPGPMDEDYAALVMRGVVQLAARDGAPVALLVLIPAEDHLLLENLAVAPEAQGQGLGGLLLRTAEDSARAAGLPEIRLYTHVRMASNIALYERHGYRETHRATVAGFARVHMAKRL